MKEVKPVLYPLFSKLVYTKNINVDTKKILSLAKKEKFKVAGVKDSMSNHAQASVCNTLLDKKSYKFLKEIILKEINFYVHNVMKYKNNFQLTKSWLTKTENNQVSDYHQHNNSFLSAVLYIKTDENSGKIGFINFSSSLFQLQVTEQNIWNSVGYTFKPSDGLLLIFPSDMFHKVLRNTSKEDRYSLAMNFIPIGKIGDTNSDSFVNILQADGK